MKYPCYIEFSRSGKLALLVHKNTKVMGRFVIHGPFSEVCENIHKDSPQVEEFQGEVFGLADYEYVDAKSESVRED